MRIIKEGATLYHELVTHGEMKDYYHDGFKASDTIEISDAQLDEIGEQFYQYVAKYPLGSMPFSKYLAKLISLAGEGR
jgi:hypothetical protein